MSFGGPAGQIALMHKLLVEEKRWVSEQRFLSGLNFCMLLPGPEAQQLATYIGWLLHGTRGALAAGTLFILPGFFVILTLSALYAAFHSAAWLGDLFFGLKCAIIAIVLEAVMRIGKRALKNGAMVAISGAAFAAIFVFGAPFPAIVLGAAILGYLVARRWPSVLAREAGEDTPGAPAALRRGWLRAFKIVAVASVLWGAPIAFSALVFGDQNIFTAIGLFFSKTAVVSFGGAYAVLAYVAQQASGALHWLSLGQMLDGLAMAETTPGPLILVLVYVGFLAGFGHAGVLPPLLAGVLGGTLAAWTTFVPSFLWVLIGAPYLEAIGRHRRLTGALSAVTAAVVGVILNLAVWFALHTLFRAVGMLAWGPVTMPLPAWGSVDIAAVALTGVALVATFALRLGMLPVLGLSAALGFAWKLFA